MVPWVAEYIWLGGNNELRSKKRVFDSSSVESPDRYYVNNFDMKNIPRWNYDGSSTGQADGNNSEVILVPVSIFKDPFHRDEAGIRYYLIWCETVNNNDEPLNNSHRRWANAIFNRSLGSKPWYGIEQEYFIIDPKTNKPLGLPENYYKPNQQGQYYCSVGAYNAFGRIVAEEHLNHCIYSNINISGINAEVAPGQWEYQIGPCTGIESGDHLWISRYLLERVAESHGYAIDWNPKPIEGDWNGSGCHTNYSTIEMREGTSDKTGLEIINEAIEKLAKNHNEHMELYGSDNELRMTGVHETARFDEFSYGVANRGASVRIGNETNQLKKGYFEDRRPSSNMDPYLVTAKIFETTVLN